MNQNYINSKTESTSLRQVLGTLPQVKGFKDIETKINKKMNSVVAVKGRGNVLMKDLFTPYTNAAVVIRKDKNQYIDLCDFYNLKNK